MNNASKTKARQGFMLIELVVALFILAVGLFGVIEIFHFGLGKLHATQESRIAMRAVQNEIETLRGMPFDELAAAEDAPFVSETPEMERLVNVRAGVTIRDYPEGEGKLREVTVTVVWTGEKGRRIEKRLTTLVAGRTRSSA